jgi:hypothetical protein
MYKQLIPWTRAAEVGPVRHANICGYSQEGQAVVPDVCFAFTKLQTVPLGRSLPNSSQKERDGDTRKAKSIYIKMDVCLCVCVCMFGHNSGTPGAISSKLGTHVVVCMYQNLMDILYIYIYIYYLLSIILSSPLVWEASMGSPPQGLPITASVTFTQTGVEATAR